MNEDKQVLTDLDRAKIFTRQAKEYRAHIEKKTMDADAQFGMFRSKGFTDVGALDMLLYTNAALREAYNARPEVRKDPNLRVSYDVTATLGGDEQYFDEAKKFNRAAPLDTGSNPGGANVIQTTLADTIIYKIEQTGQVIDLVAKDEIPYGNKEYPNMVALPVGQFIDESTTGWTDIVPTSFEDATKGLNKVKLTPRDYGLFASYSQRLLKKVSPATVAFFREVEAKGLARGIEQQILRGDATGQNAQGITGIATSITFNTNAYLTFLDAVGVLAASNTENIKAVMHRKTWQAFKRLRTINLAYKDVIDPVNMKIDDIPVILSNNTDADVSTSGNVILGDFDHYMYARTGGLETIEDIYSGAATRLVKVYHMMQIDLAAMLASSFATYSITF